MFMHGDPLAVKNDDKNTSLISGMKLLYKKPITRVRNNGCIWQTCYMERGIRQGCPISALLHQVVAVIPEVDFKLKYWGIQNLTFLWLIILLIFTASISVLAYWSLKNKRGFAQFLWYKKSMVSNIYYYRTESVFGC